MKVTVTIQFDTDHDYVVESVKELLNCTLPYMSDNVSVSSSIE